MSEPGATLAGLKLAHTFLLTTRGVPQLYYGDEIAMTGADEPTPPCGACRQILWEFAGDVPVVSATAGGKRKLYRMSELLPEPFEF